VTSTPLLGTSPRVFQMPTCDGRQRRIIRPTRRPLALRTADSSDALNLISLSPAPPATAAIAHLGESGLENQKTNLKNHPPRKKKKESKKRKSKKERIVRSSPLGAQGGTSRTIYMVFVSYSLSSDFLILFTPWDTNPTPPLPHLSYFFFPILHNHFMYA